ncbi:hypothetical protein, conserved in leishmania [Leishmania infantum JPCM5]|uniref:Uncharacterized protein n=2 Tax=Leishmania infantum TaxID=5671 RepID=A0A381M9M8_LEIIN|nr:hypothetical protein, conserved in leishmania [Leishmania infantum JPCM5]CAC9440584.1 hypothetical_protein_-_conserved [Leishmania infantum]CAC9440601.1 hypothetical_protein_-_conserved [Leishmania infantum]CAC9440618.1 hypothetical_protein_-_conserved [Leishmania infantum]CAM65040.1 hypothetical protein, conserved in leishmania [Leishmania infantum JPCM5]SUZ38811.1 hypothetical_protein_-_conserved [Leishmania infantum]|eukprot:XP_001462854.1 hypothetical protein, conserved in leishmania [Leishmania infantum JPCM5]
MGPFAPRCCALALLCAVVVLAAVLVRAESFTVTRDVTMSDASFDDYTMMLDLSSSSADVVTVQLINSQVSGSGLTVKNARGSSPSSARLSMNMAITTVAQSVITLSGVMPANSDIRIVATTGSLAPAQSLFDFSGLALDSNATVMVENTAVTWPKDSINTGSIVLISAGSNAVGIKSTAALFVLNATAINGASVVSIDTQSSFPITKGAALTVDYGRCERCSSALVSINVPLVVDASSLFRVANCKAVGASNGLLTSAGSITVSDKSAYVIHDSAVESGALFSFPTGLEDASEVYPFAVSGGSTVSFLNLKGSSTGVAAGQSVPNTLEQSNVIGGGCVINDKELRVASEYRSHGLSVETVVDSQGASSGTCANAKCIPGNTKPGATVSGTEPCTCQCSSTKHHPPFCTSVVDPMQNYDPNVWCAVPNCITCDRLDPSNRCTECDTGYSLTNDYQCKATTTITTTTKAPTCTAPYCSVCAAGSGSVCSSCRPPYTLSNGVCVANTNVAAGAHTAALAAAVCVVAAFYAL